MHTYPPICAIVSYPFSTLKAPKRLRARNRASGAIDGGAPAPDCKPSGLNRRRLATVTLPPPPRLRRTSRVFRSRRRHGNSPFGRKTRSGTSFFSSVFFARRANFRVAGEAENRPSGRFSASPAFPRFPCQTAAGTGPVLIQCQTYAVRHHKTHVASNLNSAVNFLVRCDNLTQRTRRTQRSLN